MAKIFERDTKTRKMLVDSKMDVELRDFGMAQALIENYESNTECNID